MSDDDDKKLFLDLLRMNLHEEENRMNGFSAGLAGFAAAVALAAAVFFGVGWGWVHFSLWKAEYTGQRDVIEQEYRGKAIKARAENERMVRVTQAQAELESAEMTAEAIRVVGEAAAQYPEYRNQEFMLGFSEALRAGSVAQIIYVPTEGNIPILEAGKRREQYER